MAEADFDLFRVTDEFAAREYWLVHGRGHALIVVGDDAAGLWKRASASQAAVKLICARALPCELLLVFSFRFVQAIRSENQALLLAPPQSLEDRRIGLVCLP